jgi:hypothetical protein
VPPPPVSPWRAGVAAARANLIPGIILWVVAAALVFAYYHAHGLRECLDEVGAWKTRYGVRYTMASSALFCGLLPWLFRMALPALRPKRPLAELVHGVVYWGLICCTADWFYQFQAFAWGDSREPHIVAVKTACDMLGYTPLIAAPCNALSHLWRDCNFSWTATRAAFRGAFYRNVVLPNLVPNWFVWTPGIAVVYCLPATLQLPMANLICCFWALMCISIAAESKRPATAATTAAGDSSSSCDTDAD